MAAGWTEHVRLEEFWQRNIMEFHASNKCHASSNRCLTSSNNVTVAINLIHLVTTSKALVTRSDALVTSSFYGTKASWTHGNFQAMRFSG